MPAATPDSTAATQQSFARLLAVEPVLSRIAPLADLADLPSGPALFHAGPPFADPADLPAPVANSVAAAAMHEGLAADAADALRAVAAGRIALMPAQDIGLVTPLTFVAGAGMYCLEVSDAAGSGLRRLSPLNDGPLPDALRLGTGRPAGLALLRQLTDGIGPDLARALAAPLPLLPLAARALAGGDELHGRLNAAQAEVPGFFDSSLSAESAAYLQQANQFVLNVVMAMAALMIGAGAGVPGSTMVTACGGNGRDLGWKLAGAPQDWITRPAMPPVGTMMQQGATALPAIGDSAVIDALGLGAACLRFAPELAGPLADHIDPAFLTATAHDAYIGAHPALPLDGLRLGLDLTRKRACLGIMLGMVGANGTEGLVGRGVAPWPADA
ncbi:DUF1116 domain-containing protein [Marinibaculum pumilum]|uniref:DUF1116 domain-containing protein n=1 Tax=Marinibaculum pumilum TaxID=1766165 RepID=A0ABV7KVU4_9PROT